MERWEAEAGEAPETHRLASLLYMVANHLTHTRTTRTTPKTVPCPPHMLHGRHKSLLIPMNTYYMNIHTHSHTYSGVKKLKRDEKK